MVGVSATIKTLTGPKDDPPRFARGN